jgi:acyl-CoA reductase-like NAD-dependent aldehyde dehydrogenase
MTIGGRTVSSDRTSGVVDPATGEVFAEAPSCSGDQLDEAMTAAQEAHDWGSDDRTRVELLRAAADAVQAHQQRLAAILSQEQGKPLRAATYEVGEAARWLRAAADLELPREVVQDDGRGYAVVERRPLGVVAAITPWNFPLMLCGWKLGPALRAGNTVVVKPSPFTPLSSLAMGEVLATVLPPGVVNVISGGDELGAQMTGHPAVRKISFTGSVATGKRIAAAAAPDLKRFTLELGGNDAAILLDDIDIPTIAQRLFWAAFINNGQICAGVKRVLVPEELHDDLVDALASCARTARIGAGTEERVQLGPINNRPQFDRVNDLVEDALASGGKAVTGGAPLDRPGYFFAPTILTGVAEGTRIVDEEQFGPALPVMPYTTVDEAVNRANATSFGLSGSVWSSDPDRAEQVATRLDSGIVFINDHLTLEPHIPFGGVKWSGVGVENGQWGLEEYCSLRVLYRARKP